MPRLRLRWRLEGSGGKGEGGVAATHVRLQVGLLDERDGPVDWVGLARSDQGRMTGEGVGRAAVGFMPGRVGDRSVGAYEL